MTTTLLKKLREEHAATQDAVAKKFGISRPTYISLEQGKRELTLREAEHATRIFDISLEELLDGKRRNTIVSLQRTKGRTKVEPPADIRISVPMEDKEKFKQVLLYLLGKVGGKPHVGMTVLYKLLYFIDFDYYEKYEEQLMGATYIHNHYGPSPIAFAKIVKEMEHEDLLETIETKYFQHDQKRFLPHRSPDLTLLSGQEIAHIDSTLARLGNKNANELTELSHRDVPWMGTREGEQLDYESVFYRSNETSQRDYADDPL